MHEWFKFTQKRQYEPGNKQKQWEVQRKLHITNFHSTMLNQRAKAGRKCEPAVASEHLLVGMEIAILWSSSIGLYTGCEFDCIAEQNAPHFRHFATQISAWGGSFYNVKSYTNLSLMMNEQKIAVQNFQMNSHPAHTLAMTLGHSVNDDCSDLLAFANCKFQSEKMCESWRFHTFRC